MQYLRTRLSSLTTPGVTQTQDQPVRPTSVNIPAQTFNSVVFANHPSAAVTPHTVSTNGAIHKINPTHRQSSTTLSVIHDYEPNEDKKDLPSLPNYSEIPSPSDSYHSVLSQKIENSPQDGVTNIGYVGSHHNLRDTNNPELRPTRVIREQYWSWNWFFANWTNREKIFLLVIVILSLIITALLATLGMVIERSEVYRKLLNDFTFSSSP